MSKKNKEKIRIVQILNQMNSGGIEAIVLNYFRNIDKERFGFDFIVCENSSCPYEDEILETGARIYRVPLLSRPLDYYKRVKDIIHENDYDIVHCHMGTLSFLPLFAAKKAGAKVRICHNHTTVCKEEGLRALAKYMFRPISRMEATEYFACSKIAGDWMYGNKNYYVMANTISVESFRFNKKYRQKIRDRYGINDDTFLIGHIGRFAIQKNHKFLIDILEDHNLHNEKKAFLLLLGEGKLLNDIREYAKDRGCDSYVIFGGIAKDTAPYYSAMDVFCLPSFFEGLPVVALEAQANGLPLLLSDKISEEAGLNENCVFLPIDNGTGPWEEALKSCKRTEIINVSDIEDLVADLEKKYEDLMGY